MAAEIKAKLYNEDIKERFFKESGWGEDFIKQTRVTFKHTSRLENSLNKDIYQFTSQETADLLHFLQLKSKAQVMQIVSVLSKYQAWAYRENFTDNPVNYFSSLYNSSNAKDFISSVAKETRLISEEQLMKYEYELTSIGDYVDAALLRGCFIGLHGTEFKELLELTIDKVKPDKIILDNRSIKINDYEYSLFLNAHNQPEMVSLKGENTSRVRPLYLKIPYIFKKVNKPEKIAYYSFAAKILSIGDYLGHPGLTAKNLYFSGMVATIKKMMENDNADPETVFEEYTPSEYFEKLKEIYGFEGAPRYLKYKLKDYFDVN